MNHLPPFIKYPLLENDNVLLREIDKNDIPSIKSITTYNRVLAETNEIAWKYAQKIKDDYIKGQSVHWGIIDKKSNQIIGTCGYYRGFENNRGELGCVLLPEYRGKGLMKEALQLAICFGYSNLHLEEVFALTNSNNEQAINLLNSLDFKFTKKIDELDIEVVYKKAITKW